MELRQLAADHRTGVAPTGTDLPALVCRGVGVALGDRQLLVDLDLVVERGETVAIVGPSGSGKTTLLHGIAGIRPVDRGTIRIGGDDITGVSDRVRRHLRLRHVGLVFQFGELLPELTVAENVGLPMRLRGQDPGAAVAAVLRDVGLEDRADEPVTRLSGGEGQRVGIARALVGSPALLLADEPTGALDAHLSEVVCELLLAQARTRGAGLVVATHDPVVAAAADRVLRLVDGRLAPP